MSVSKRVLLGFMMLTGCGSATAPEVRGPISVPIEGTYLMTSTVIDYVCTTPDGKRKEGDVQIEVLRLTNPTTNQVDATTYLGDVPNSAIKWTLTNQNEIDFDFSNGNTIATSSYALHFERANKLSGLWKGSEKLLYGKTTTLGTEKCNLNFDKEMKRKGGVDMSLEAAKKE